MLLFLATVAAATPDQIDICSAAMRGLGVAPQIEIEKACPTPPARNIWTDEDDGRCDGALKFARDAARMAHGLTPVMVRGMIAEFDKRVAKCRAPKPPVPERKDVPRLWD